METEHGMDYGTGMGSRLPPRPRPPHLSGDEALDGVGEHDDTGIEEASGVGDRVPDAVVVEEVSLGHLQEGEEASQPQHQAKHEADGDRGVGDSGEACEGALVQGSEDQEGVVVADKRWRGQHVITSSESFFSEYV